MTWPMIAALAVGGWLANGAVFAVSLLGLAAAGKPAPERISSWNMLCLSVPWGYVASFIVLLVVLTPLLALGGSLYALGMAVDWWVYRHETAEERAKRKAREQLAKSFKDMAEAARRGR